MYFLSLFFFFVLLRYSHNIKFTLFLTSDFNFVHFAFLYFSRFQGQTCKTLIIIKKGKIFLNVLYNRRCGAKYLDFSSLLGNFNFLS